MRQPHTSKPPNQTANLIHQTTNPLSKPLKTTKPPNQTKLSRVNFPLHHPPKNQKTPRKEKAPNRWSAPRSTFRAPTARAARAPGGAAARRPRGLAEARRGRAAARPRGEADAAKFSAGKRVAPVFVLGGPVSLQGVNQKWGQVSFCF